MRRNQGQLKLWGGGWLCVGPSIYAAQLDAERYSPTWLLTEREEQRATSEGSGIARKDAGLRQSNGGEEKNKHRRRVTLEEVEKESR